MSGYTTLSGTLGGRRRRKQAQAMRTESVRVEGSRWNRPCVLEGACSSLTFCYCNLPPIVKMRARGCNRIACSFLKWCRAIPSRAELAPPWRGKEAHCLRTTRYAHLLMRNAWM